jgi:hypothetical protein
VVDVVAATNPSFPWLPNNYNSNYWENVNMDMSMATISFKLKLKWVCFNEGCMNLFLWRLWVYFCEGLSAMYWGCYWCPFYTRFISRYLPYTIWMQPVEDVAQDDMILTTAFKSLKVLWVCFHLSLYECLCWECCWCPSYVQSIFACLLWIIWM